MTGKMVRDSSPFLKHADDGTASVIDGKAVAEQLRKEITASVDRMKDKYGKVCFVFVRSESHLMVL
jgi:uncharacterized protein (DUF2141 family)